MIPAFSLPAFLTKSNDPSATPRRTRSRARSLGAVAVAALVSACGPAAVPSGINDPNEARNRDIHAFNRGVDRMLLRPTANTYSSILPEPVEQGISNFATNLDAPGDVVNNLLQFRLGKAAENTLRFAINSTIGIGGLFDPATAMGVAGDPTDFGETLHVWGAPEGQYAEVPFMGPTTDRDLVGVIVDVALNPVRLALPEPESYYATGTKVASRLSDRARYGDTVDSVLYESADSYAQTRLLYLQNRRFQLGQSAAGGEAAFEDPYSDFEDPYAE
ncbi:VacJ family lipoprotein [Rhodobacteraceae bacterium HSP-20]|uniref:VacJ family lipoprotein n=1 Tax=Paragemmobacter amnigenus TaxID=2852097 RepID=A0ABS6J5C8_9RHOB|nr:VacJ family lipoprotein [Rhodobacter amnigenus]MBU9697590.1 VacJ family lipoprotein [Rhodobacter amnigenus]MBV4388817.1 VacJ family lipoprotein [Rhodobacter amnigenus]